MTFVDLDRTALKATSICTLVLLLKWYISISIQGDTRFKAGSRAPEDAAFGGRMGAENVEQTFGLTSAANDASNQAEKMRELRWQRIIMNDLENIPLGLIIAWSSLVTPKSPLVHTVSVVTFAVMRILHTVTYARSLQPHRSIVWMLALVATLVMAVNGVVGALSL
ncbi:hypothetical protein CcCBS67573_g03151 [Chytriomyces confervae]|uniref:Microsomal glutathione S-transferase 1 n=1 Tax=Chytriomyces confervae TaxID=246404 RepID=A0A507FH39_9FUNG|nr:hypothetical protein HDU80_005021 [Chytriomyces hyalinus]TPX75584.1 hypothetical protein CcCBS67573_g03151 [Chytriomyces confervae]